MSKKKGTSVRNSITADKCKKVIDIHKEHAIGSNGTHNIITFKSKFIGELVELSSTSVSRIVQAWYNLNKSTNWEAVHKEYLNVLRGIDSSIKLEDDSFIEENNLYLHDTKGLINLVKFVTQDIFIMGLDFEQITNKLIQAKIRLWAGDGNIDVLYDKKDMEKIDIDQWPWSSKKYNAMIEPNGKV